MSLQLPVGSLTVLLGPALARHRVMAALDESTGRCTSGHAAVSAVRLAAAPADAVADRLEAVEDVRRGSATIVLVDRFTEGLGAGDRAALLRELAALADGRAVLVHDRDPVAALAVAGGALRIGATGELAYEPIDEPDYLAS